MMMIMALHNIVTCRRFRSPFFVILLRFIGSDGQILVDDGIGNSSSFGKGVCPIGGCPATGIEFIPLIGASIGASIP
jgi:hypothetical protein